MMDIAAGMCPSRANSCKSEHLRTHCMHGAHAAGWTSRAKLAGRLMQVRNYVLFRWREDVSRYLSEEEAAASVSSRHRKYVGAAWRFLNCAGHINFGVGEGLLRRAAELPASNGTVVVVGAGLAGTWPRL